MRVYCVGSIPLRMERPISLQTQSLAPEGVSIWPLMRTALLPSGWRRGADDGSRRRS